MYNRNSIFPSYTNLSDIRVSLPAPPSRSKIARDVEDLWDIHQSEPHVIIHNDQGIGVPLPSNGYNPNGLSDDNAVNELINRGSHPISEQENLELLRQFEELYQNALSSNESLISSNVGDLKVQIKSSHPSALTLYNGNDTTKLVEALSIIQSAENLSRFEVDQATFPVDEKAKLISFFSKSLPLSNAMLNTNHNILQSLMGNTLNIDHVEDVLAAFGLKAIENPSAITDPAFADHIDAIELAKEDLSLAENLSIISGDVKKSIDNSISNLSNVSSNAFLNNAVAQPIKLCLTMAFNDCSKSAGRIQRHLQNLASDLEKIGVSPSNLNELNHKLNYTKSVQNMSQPETPSFRESTSEKRSAFGIDIIQNFLIQANQDLQNSLMSQNFPTHIQLALLCELYCIQCMLDNCIALRKGKRIDQVLAKKLHKSLISTIKDSKINAQKEENLKNAQESLLAEQKLKTINDLETAKKDNLISERS